MKKGIIIVLLVSIFCMLSGCSLGSKDAEARKVLESYLEDAKNGDYEAAYDLLCSYDKENISKEVFIAWRNAVSKIVEINSYTISEKSDKFGKMEVCGVVYTNSYGFDVSQDLKKLIDKADLSDLYEKDEFKQMVVYEDDKWKIGLFYEDLEFRTETYNNLIKESGK